MNWQSFVAIGDSFTEGVGDPGPDGHCRGWADRVAEALAAERSGFTYANLAVRGRLLGQILDEQLPVALEMRPDLVSLSGGVNDILRPKVDIDEIGRQLAAAVAELRAGGSEVILFVGIDPTARSRWLGRVRPRVVALNAAVRQVAEAHRCYAVDMWGATVFHDTRMWAPDRLHLSRLGHERTASAVLETLTAAPDAPDWRMPLPTAVPPGWMATRRDDVRWVATFVAPWMLRRVRGRSSGDGRVAKRPRLEPL